MAEYFCYVSEAKVGDLISQIDTHAVSSREEAATVETERSVNATVGKLLGLFSAGTLFGKRNRLVVSEVKQETAIQKLGRVIEHLVEAGAVKDLLVSIEGSTRLDALYYLYEGAFRVRDCDDDFAYLESDVSTAIVLELVCSLKYFSDMGREAGRVVPHSGNRHFFSGQSTPTFKTVVVVQDFKDGRLLGSPLFLALSPVQGLNI